jgi:hypothetical protein
MEKLAIKFWQRKNGDYKVHNKKCGDKKTND